MDPALSVSAAHQVGERVRRSVLHRWPKVAEVLIAVRGHDPVRMFRPQHEIMAEITEAAAQEDKLHGISHLRLHFVGEEVVAEVRGRGVCTPVAWVRGHD